MDYLCRLDDREPSPVWDALTRKRNAESMLEFHAKVYREEPTTENRWQMIRAQADLDDAVAAWNEISNEPLEF